MWLKQYLDCIPSFSANLIFRSTIEPADRIQVLLQPHSSDLQVLFNANRSLSTGLKRPTIYHPTNGADPALALKLAHLFPPISYFGQLLNQLIESRYCFSHIRVIYKSPIDTLKDIEIRKGEGSTFLLNAILGTITTTGLPPSPPPYHRATRPSRFELSILPLGSATSNWGFSWNLQWTSATLLENCKSLLTH
jgi:hypothetical protein